MTISFCFSFVYVYLCIVYMYGVCNNGLICDLTKRWWAIVYVATFLLGVLRESTMSTFLAATMVDRSRRHFRWGAPAANKISQLFFPNLTSSDSTSPSAVIHMVLNVLTVIAKHCKCFDTPQAWCQNENNDEEVLQITVSMVTRNTSTRKLS